MDKIVSIVEYYCDGHEIIAVCDSGFIEYSDYGGNLGPHGMDY
jgi:hypothetical protein